MFIPLRTDRPPKRRPLVTEALIVVNLLVYLIGVAGTYFGTLEAGSLSRFGHFYPQEFQWWQLLSYQFLHDPGGIWHIAFNMLFLWVFGCAVEDRLGRTGFLGFYLVGGAVAAIAHSALAPESPVIGASGSIAGVTGAYLALFPRSRIKVLVIFFFIGIFSVPSLWFIAFYFAIDVLRQSSSLLGGGEGNVAYTAHIAGYIYGFGTGFLLLATSVLKREEFDVFFVFTQARRRATFRAASRQGPAGLWESAQADTAKRLARQQTRAKPKDPKQTQRAELRDRINLLISDGDLPAAARTYQKLLSESPDKAGAALSERPQLDVASQLYSQEEYADAATAYELLLASYPSSAKTAEVRLILGLIYARKLDRPTRARELIEQAKTRLRDASQTALAEKLLTELKPLTG